MADQEPRVDTVFAAAIEMDSPDERHAYLERACGKDPALRRQVDRLLRAHFEAGGFLDSPVLEDPNRIDVAVTERPGTQVGPYKLLEEIGEGGFGVVYMAQQEKPVRRTVALKVIKPGMDSRQVIARFDAERQALALMDHPNVARVLDAGATGQGRPFFVMDLIRGIPITEYADQASLSTRERLELFLEVCQGVQHAHQKGIIHRDLKPTNVLVTLHGSKALPKVIDFGVSKAIHQQLTERTLYTRFAQMIGTPLYMSPEQAALSDLDVDTRSDIYSLGVLLYELLTGTTPLEKGQLGEASYDQIRNAIRETEPPTPSQRLATTNIEVLRKIAACRRTEPRKVAELLRGDLDWIIMKALEKDRTRRYETTSAFAQDIGRYLSDEPVEARPPSTWYRARKFARRNKVSLWIAACLLLAVTSVVGSVGWLVGERAARLGEADRQARESLLVAEAALESRDWQEARVAVTRAQGLVVSQGSGPGTAVRIAELTRDLDMVARLEGIQLGGIDPHAGSKVLHTRASDKHRGIFFGYDLDAANGKAASAGYGLAAEKYKAAFAAYGLPVQTLEIGEAARRIRARSIALELAASLEAWAANLKELEEETRCRHLLSIVQQADPHPLRDRVRELWAEGDRDGLEEFARKAEIEELSTFSVRVIGYALQQAGAVEAAIAFLERAQRRHPADYRINHQLSDLMCRSGRWDEAIRLRSVQVGLRPESYDARIQLGAVLHIKGLQDQAIAEFREALRIDAKEFLAHALLADALREKGDYDEAIAQYGVALQIKSDSAQAHSNLGNALQKKGDLDKAIEEYEEAVRLDPEEAAFHSNLGNGLLANGQVEDAIQAYQEALCCYPKFAGVHSNIGRALTQAGRVDEAIDACERAVKLDPDFAMGHFNLGKALQAKSLMDKAIQAFSRAIQLDPEHAAACNELGNALHAKGRVDDAIRAYREAIRREPGCILAHANLGDALRDAAHSHRDRGEQELAWGFLDQAIEAYREAIKIDARLAKAHAQLGLVLAERGQPEKGIAACKKAIELDPQFACSYHNLGRVLMMKGDHEAAIRALKESAGLEPKHSGHYVDLAFALQKERRFEEARDAFAGALEITPAHPGVCNALAWLLATCPQAELRDPARAIKLARKAIEIAPMNGNSYSTLGAAEYRMGNWKEAIAALEKSFELRAGGHGFDFFFLAMAHRQMGNEGKAREAYDRAVRWVAASAPGNEDLRRLRAEAERLLRSDS